MKCPKCNSSNYNLNENIHMIPNAKVDLESNTFIAAYGGVLVKSIICVDCDYIELKHITKRDL